MAQRYIPENPRRRISRTMPGQASNPSERTLPGGPSGGSFPNGSNLNRGNVDVSRTSGLRGGGMTGGFNKYAAGEKRYGASGRTAPNIGPTNSPEGYQERDLLARTRKAAMMRKLKSLKGGSVMQPDVLRNMPR